MRFSLRLGLIISFALGNVNYIQAASEEGLFSASFTAYFSKDGKWINPESKTQSSLNEPEGIRFNLQLHRACSLEDLLRTYLNTHGIKFEKLTAYKVSFLPYCGEMVTHIESIPSSAAVSPALAPIEPAISSHSVRHNFGYQLSPLPELTITLWQPEQNKEFTRWNALLSLKGKELVDVLNGESLKVTFRTPSFVAD